MSTPPGKREWQPRMWEGCNFFAWSRLLVRNHFAVGWRQIYIALIITVVSLFHTVLRFIQEQLYADRFARTPIRHAPLFIVGHWRTGTTLLHELLILDDRHSYPNTYQCLDPNHFLLTERLITRYLHFLMPSRRPMDNMAAGWDKPQEDEFALCMLGQPSPYLTVAFPNGPPQDQDAFTLRGWSRKKRWAWQQTFLTFLRQLTYKDPRRLVLKSPTHSCRIAVLREMFPDAKFVHIVRDPWVVYPSTINLWKSLYETHGLQTPTFAGLEEHVLSTFRLLYEELEQGKKEIPRGFFHELRYEDLVANPMQEMAKLYDALQLGEFNQVRPKIEHYFDQNRGYQTNRYPSLDESTRQQIAERWGPVLERYGYPKNLPTN